jgi:putative membrane protein
MSFTDLPLINACLNGLATVLLAAGYVFIKRGNQAAHKKCMLAAFAASCVFLVGYVFHKVYVVKGVNTPFAGPEALKPWYLLMLATHVILAMLIVPLALTTIVLGLKGKFETHKKVARWTWPIWMYVSVTGVIIYLLLYQIYPAK